MNQTVPILSPQAGFLITNALRFMFKAPGVTSWQYTLLQLQARVDLLPAVLLCRVLFCLVPPQLAESLFLSPGGGVWVGEGCVAGHPSPSSAICGGSSLGSSGMFTPSQVNGMLPILPLLFPVLWVLATACGEARVLAQMSKASPSSLVGCSRAVEDDVRNKAS